MRTLVHGALAGVAMLALSCGAWAQSAVSAPSKQHQIQYGVRATTTWSDNVRRRSEGGDSGAVLELSPYVVAESSAPRAKYRLFYQMRNFVRLDEDEQHLFRHALNANGSFALVDDRLGVDLSGFMGTIGASPMGVISSDPASSFGNTSNVRHFSISPWLRNRLGSFATYQMRYRLSHSGGSTGYATASRKHRASAQVDGIPGGSKWNWRWLGEFQRRDFRNHLTRDRRYSSAMLLYDIGPTLRVFGMLDYEYIEGLRDRHGDEAGFGPGAGFEWTPSRRTRIDGSISKRYYGTVGNLGLSHSMRHATMGLRWSRSMLTSADASLLTFDPASLVSGSFDTMNPVLANLVSSGIVLPPGTILTQGMFTDAAVLDRRLTAFWGLRGVRNALTFTGYRSDRESSTEMRSSAGMSGIRGNDTFGGIFIGEIDERGLVASFSHRLDSRSALDFTVDHRTIESPTASFKTRYESIRIGYSRQFTPDVSGFAGARHALQRGKGRGTHYDENSIYAGVDMRFY